MAGSAQARDTGKAIERWLNRHGYLLFAAVFAVMLLGLAVDRLSREPSQPIVFRSSAGVAVGSPIRIHVAGEVAKPGVYEMFEGERVIDAIEIAGGATGSADTSALNLARKLRDGEKLEVPSTDDAGSATRVLGLLAGQLIDINSATEAELDALPGIGKAYSKRIVDSRAADGPFKKIEDLLTRNVVPASTFDAIRLLITIGQ